jgi:hypothetical protein
MRTVIIDYSELYYVKMAGLSIPERYFGKYEILEPENCISYLPVLQKGKLPANPLNL